MGSSENRTAMRQAEDRRLCPDAHGVLLVERAVVAEAMRAAGRTRPLSRSEVRAWLADLTAAPEEGIAVIAAASLARSRLDRSTPPWDPAPLTIGAKAVAALRGSRRRRGPGVVWVTKPELRSRGWTDAAVRDFLPRPQSHRRNPHPQGRRRPMPLWTRPTVDRIEATAAWRSWLERSLRRRGIDPDAHAANAFRRNREHLAPAPRTR